MRPVPLVIALLVGLLLATACGGGTSHPQHSTTKTQTSAASTERTRLLSELRSGLEAPASPVANVSDLDDCIVQQASGLPLATVRKLATANPDASITDPLLARCVAQGKGLSFVRGVIADVVAGKLPPPIPAAFSRCVVAGVDTLTPAQLAAALNQGATGNQSYSRRLGQRLALACVEKPSVFAQWRKLWVAGIRRSLNGQHLPAAFEQCVLAKADRIGGADLVKLVQEGSAAETAYGQKLGRECRSAVSG
jgi:hypothetical protein